jgi:cytochrome P450
VSRFLIEAITFPRFMLHDPEIYPDPLEFNPERFNGDDVEMEKVKDLVFGFGRRFCPGRYFSGGTTFALIATTLATCDILPGLDEDGKEVLPKVAYTPGLIT